MALEISKCYSYNVHLISEANFMSTLATMEEYWIYISWFLAIGQVLQILLHFEILTWVSKGKS